MRYLLYILLTFNYILSPALSLAAPNVVVSIKPVHSLVSGVMQGVSRPELLIHSNQSIHHYSLKPSDRRLLANADLIFWVGSELEIFLPRLLNNLDRTTRVVSLIENEKLTRLPMRQIHNEHNDKHQQPDRPIWDGHIWLNTHNVDVMINDITQHLVKIDPDNAPHYKNNQKKLHEQTKNLRKNLHAQLGKTSQPFISYHDAYQYFEHEFKLNNKGFVTGSEELSPGAHRILEVKKIIASNSIQCVFYDTPLKPSVIKTLMSETGVKSIELDPTGMQFEYGDQAWFKIMRTMAASFNSCLQPH